MSERPIISFVVAMDERGLIGRNNGLPWRLPDDMRWFREVTMGKPVVMGRKTYESIPARFRPLVGRHNIIITRNRDYRAEGATVVHSMEEALAAAGDVEEVMIGGERKCLGRFWVWPTVSISPRSKAYTTGTLTFPSLTPMSGLRFFPKPIYPTNDTSIHFVG